MTPEQEKRREEILASFDGKLVYSAAVKDLLIMVDHLREELRATVDRMGDEQERLTKLLQETEGLVKP